MKIELVTWRDAGSDADDMEWAASEHIRDDNPIITSVGYVVKETVMNLTLAMDHCAADGTTHTRSRIPIGMIVDRTVLLDLSTVTSV